MVNDITCPPCFPLGFKAGCFGFFISFLWFLFIFFWGLVEHATERFFGKDVRIQQFLPPIYQMALNKPKLKENEYKK
jgi:hypothetical protein